ncbi:hypothetical protein L0337_44130 [candidate division KSB1 bacterium]|nr:hypothetical protein [candidate division KSB1 bacterium]
MLSHRKTFQFLIILLLFVAGTASLSQTLESGPQVLTFFSDVDDTEQPYGLYLPKNFNPAKKYPLVIMLHGAGSNHRLALRRVFGKSNLPGSEAIASRHIYVYGDADNPSPEELQARREQAEHAANWPVYRGAFLGRVMVFPRVLADKEVRPSDLEASNLILFGTKETNSLIAKFSAQLPMHLDTTASDYGLVYIFPVGEHYLLINSGLPWWSVAGSGQANPPMYGPPGLLMDFKDYLLFKDSADNVVAEGRFDNNWRMPESDAEKMKVKGAVNFTTVHNEPNEFEH